MAGARCRQPVGAQAPFACAVPRGGGVYRSQLRCDVTCKCARLEALQVGSTCANKEHDRSVFIRVEFCQCVV